MENKLFTPINILWIEDNPLWHRGKCSNVRNENGESIFDSSLDGEYLPAINLTGELAGQESFFKLKVLQHPEEIKEYFSLCLIVEDQQGSASLGEIEGVVPEMVVFDYKLFENIRINQAGEDKFSMPYSRPTQPIREFINPNFAILNKFPDTLSEFKLHLENSKSSNYDEYEFIRRIYSPADLSDEERELLRTDIKDDEFGLYAGIEIVKLFRQHACVGIPATANKPDRKSLHPFSRFYEWLNENDLSTALQREDRGNKTWNSILKDGTKQLRKRIVALVQIGTIIPSYNQLIELSRGNSSDGKVFSFTSDYAERHLPLDGLFIDEPEETKIEKIKEWAGELIQSLTRNTAGAIKSNTAEINKAIEISEELWKVFTERFGDRMELSNLAYWESTRSLNAEELSAEEKERFEKLKTDFCNDKGEIGVKSSIQESFKGIGNKEVNYTLRLAVLHLAAKAAIEMNKCKRSARAKEIYRELDKNEYFNLLFPIVKLVFSQI